ncbi:MAG: VacJ family lipoprotein [Nitrosomonadales bacterium]|nr:VacJ family lipoprotein [Nitrosomonadales bacterium]
MSVIRILLLLATSFALGGCASTHNNPKDPFESFNRGVYKFNDALDKAIIKPAAKGYTAVVPAPGRMMVTNFFSNIDDVVVTANDLLQLKVKQAVADCGRFVVNSTVGLFGLADVATALGLEKHKEDFGQTLGFWGVGNGPYMVLPILGPSTLRDSIGDLADSNLGVVNQIEQVDTRNQLLVTDMLNRRAKLLDRESLLEEAMLDPYSFIRDAYLQRRLNQVYDGNPPREKFDDEDDSSKPDQHSANDPADYVQPVAARDEPAHFGVSRVWVSQRPGNMLNP